LNSKKFHSLFLFFGLLVLLLRPFAVYSLTSQSMMAGDSQKANSLFQRLIKKKDDHHHPSPVSSYAEANIPTFRFCLPVNPVARFLRKVNALYLASIAGFVSIKNCAEYIDKRGCSHLRI
jgi:hypothetical protein